MSVVQGQEKELLLSASQENDPTQEPLQCKVDPLPTGTPSSQEIRLFRPVASSLCLGGQMSMLPCIINDTFGLFCTVCTEFVCNRRFYCAWPRARGATAPLAPPLSTALLFTAVWCLAESTQVLASGGT